VKFDGFRIQVHKEGKDVALFSRGGTDWTDRYRAVSEAVARLPVNAIVLDAELTAHKLDGSLDFGALLRKRQTHLSIWIFDVLFQNDKDLSAAAALGPPEEARCSDGPRPIEYNPTFRSLPRPAPAARCMCRAQTRRHRIQTWRHAVSFRAQPALDKGQVPRMA
jgi:hypothetical protein